MEQRRAVVLLSGGLDSATVLAIARAEGFVPYALTVAYGQRHAIEIDAAGRVAAAAGVARHLVVPIDLRAGRLRANRRRAGAQGSHAGSDG